MKKLQELCAATALLFVLSVSVLAGNIHTPGVATPPPPPPEAATMTAANETSSGGEVTAIESETLFTEITVSLLQLLSVF